MSDEWKHVIGQGGWVYRCKCCDIVEGRDRPPTPGEARAHDGCLWMHSDGDLWNIDPTPTGVYASVSRDGMFVGSTLPTSGRWWAWRDGPVAWPVTP